MPELQVPLATYTGWNLRRAGFGKDSFCVATGAYIPFAATRDARRTANDPRLSLEERYATRSDYLRMLTRAVDDMITDRLLLTEDAPRILQRAEKAAEVLQR